MTCRTAREQLNLLIAGERLESSRLYVALARHWLGCAACRAAGRRLACCRRVARHLPVPPPPPGLRARVLSALPPAGASSPALARSPRGIQMALFGAGAAVLVVALGLAAGRWGGEPVNDHVVNRGTIARVNLSPQPPPRSGEGESGLSLVRAQAGRHRSYGSAGIAGHSISPPRFGRGGGAASWPRSGQRRGPVPGWGERSTPKGGTARGVTSRTRLADHANAGGVRLARRRSLYPMLRPLLGAGAD